MLTTILITITLLLFISLIKKNKKFRRNDPLGPFELPVIGSLHRLSSQPHRGLMKLSETYGKVFKLWMGDYYTIVVSDPIIIREIFQKNNDKFIDRPSTPTFTIFSGNHNNLATAHGEKWRYNRSLVSNAFTKTKLKTTHSVIDNQSKRLINQMLLFNDKLFNSKNYYKKYSLNIITSLIFNNEIPYDGYEKGGKLDTMGRQIDDVFRATGTGNPADLISFLAPFYTIQLKYADQQISYLYDFVKEIYNDHLKNLDPQKPKDLFDQLIIESDGKDVDGVIRIGMDLMLAGGDTSSSTLEWFSLYMANNPDIQEKAYKELRDVIKGGDNSGGANDPNTIYLGHRPSTPYLNAIIKEVMRIKPAAPLSLPRICTEDIEIGPYFIPKGTQVIPNIFALHHDQHHFTDPFKFQPQRFLLDNHQLYFMPFLIGARNCVGSNLALDEIYVACANILLNFSISTPLDNIKIDETEVFGLTIHPKDSTVKLSIRN